MYTEHFNLSAPPFQLTPDPRFLFESSVHARAIAHLQYGLQQGEGFIVVTGDVGAGKTTIIGHLIDSLDRHKYVATTVVTTNISPDHIIRMIASGFGLPHEGRDKAHLLLDIEAYLHECVRRNKRCLIFVDEAQNLDMATLEELRMLSNIHVNGMAPVQLFLLGQPQFRSILAQPDLRQLRQRVIASYHLGPLDEEETQNYILHRLTRVGWDGEHPTFTDDAFPLIYQFTEGVPRSINTLCSRILLFSCLEDNTLIDRKVVDLVARDLEEEFEQVLDHDDDEAPETHLEKEPEETAAHSRTAPEPEPETARESVHPAASVADTEAPAPKTAVPEPSPTETPAPETNAAGSFDVTPQVDVTFTQQPAPLQAAPQQPTDVAIPAELQKNLSPEGWKEVFDIIESTPVEALAALGQNDALEPDIPDEHMAELADHMDELPSVAANTDVKKALDAFGPSNAHNKIFKRLLLLILEEYLKGRPGPPDQKSQASGI